MFVMGSVRDESDNLCEQLCLCLSVCILVMCPTQILSTMKKMKSKFFNYLTFTQLVTSLNMHMYFRDHKQLECRNELVWGFKTHSPVDVVPVDDIQ